MRRLAVTTARPQPTWSTLWCTLRFAGESAPSTDEIRKAFSVLNCPSSTTFGDIRKKYLDLAKQHHPDVAGGSQGKPQSSHHNMSAINEAYEVLQRANKAGCLSSATQSSQQRSANHPHQNFNQGEYYEFQRNPYADPSAPGGDYQPMWEDVPPEFYEAMWQQMHEGDPGFYHFAMDDPNPRHYQKQQRANRRRDGNHQRQNQANQKSNQGSHNGPQSDSQGGDKNSTKGASGSSGVTWSEEELRALRNMYQDGKSFEFIANALGKQQQDVVAEFNRWYRSQNGNKKQRGGGPPRPGSTTPYGDASNYYSGVPPDAFSEEEAFYHPYAFGADGEPLDAHVYYDVDPDVEMEMPRPFRDGQHFMHRGGRGGGRGRGNSQNNRRRPNNNGNSKFRR